MNGESLITLDVTIREMPVGSMAETVIERLAAGQSEAGLRLRPILGPGDLPALPLPALRTLFSACTGNGLGFGVAATFAQDDLTAHYGHALSLAAEHDRAFVLDAVVSPKRLISNPRHAARVRGLLSMAGELHLQIPLAAAMSCGSPEETAAALDDALGGREACLAFDRRIAGHAGAAGWARRFYAATEAGRRFLAAEIARFSSEGPHLAFLSRAFHVDASGTVHASAHTMYGDTALDAPPHQPLGSLLTTPLGQILSGRAARRHALLAEARLLADPVCALCLNAPACLFNGVGAVKHAHPEVDGACGGCLGPRALAPVPAMGAGS